MVKYILKFLNMCRNSSHPNKRLHSNQFHRTPVFNKDKARQWQQQIPLILMNEVSNLDNIQGDVYEKCNNKYKLNNFKNETYLEMGRHNLCRSQKGHFEILYCKYAGFFLPNKKTILLYHLWCKEGR